jgi:hypothetical protein
MTATRPDPIEKLDKLGLSFLNNRKELWPSRGDTPHATFEYTRGFLAGASCDVIKTWQPGNEKKPYARWLARVYGGPAYDEAGDTYVYDILVHSGAKLVSVAGRKPTKEELLEVEQLRSRVPSSDF